MITNILNIDSLEKEATEIDKFLNITSSDDIEELVYRGNELVVYLARSVKMLADAKYHLDNAIVKITEEAKNDMPPSVFNKYIQSKCARENYLVNWIERINRTCVHQIDFIRTLISKAKAEMQYLNQ